MKISKFNWILTCVNGVIFLVLFIGVVLPGLEANFKSLKLEKEIGMKTYVFRRPFRVLVDRSFPKNTSYKFLKEGCPYLFSVNDVDDEKDQIQMDFAIGTEFSITCTVSREDPSKIYEIIISNGYLFQKDFNGDGIFDVRHIMIPENVMSIRIGDRWVQVEQDVMFEKYRRQVLNSEWYRFDIGIGEWLNESERKGKEKG